MIPAMRVKADGTICMDWDVFRAARPEDICRTLAAGKRRTAAHASVREQRALTVNTFIGNVAARNASNTGNG